MASIYCRNSYRSSYSYFWSELKARIQLLFLVKRKQIKEHLSFQESHEWNFEHDVKEKKCCYNQKRRKAGQKFKKARFMADNNCAFKSRRNALPSISPAVHMLVCANMNCSASPINDSKNSSFSDSRATKTYSNSLKVRNSRNSEKRKLTRFCSVVDEVLVV